jgi:hypothetical protein
MNVVVLSALRTGHLYCQKIFVVLVFIKGWVDPGTTVRSERLCQWKILMTGYGTRDLPACSAVPQPTSPPCAPTINGRLINPNTRADIHVLPNLRTTVHSRYSLFYKDTNSQQHSLVCIRSFHDKNKQHYSAVQRSRICDFFYLNLDSSSVSYFRDRFWSNCTQNQRLVINMLSKFQFIHQQLTRV